MYPDVWVPPLVAGLDALPISPPALPPTVFQDAPPPAPATIIRDFNDSKSFHEPDSNLISVAPPPAPAASTSLLSQVPYPPPLYDVVVLEPTIASAPFCPTYIYNFWHFSKDIVPDVYAPFPPLTPNEPLVIEEPPDAPHNSIL